MWDKAGGRVEIRLDRPDGPLVGVLTVQGTGSWEAFAEQTAGLTGAEGVHDVYFVFVNQCPGNFEWFRFTDLMITEE